MNVPGYELRPATPGDAVAATAILRAVGLAMPEGDEAAKAHWRRLWQDNPALGHGGGDPLPGWFLEFDGRVVGFFGNYAQTYWQGKRAFKVAIASQWGIEKAHRTATAMLSDAYFAQPNAEMILVTTGIKPTGRLFERFGGEPVPQPGLDQIRFWVTASGGFLAATLSKKGWPGGGLARHLNLPLALTWPRPARRPAGAGSGCGKRP